MTLAARLLQWFANQSQPAETALRLTVVPEQTAPAVPPSIAVTPSEDDQDVVAEVERHALERATQIGMSELRAASLMVSQGHATRVVLAAFEVWPGLLTEIERLSAECDLNILPTIVRPGGRIDIEISRPPDPDE